MGACDFTCTASGRDADEAFRNAVETAQYDRGHEGYTGTIAEKHDYVLIEDTWKTLKNRYNDGVKGLNSIIKALDESAAPKFDRSAVTAELDRLAVPVDLSWGTKTKGSALKQLRTRAKELRMLRDTCKPKMSTGDIAEHLLAKLFDERIDDKWGPAGCIDMDPKLTGKRKPKRFLFFGWASS